MRKLIYPNKCNDNGWILVIHTETYKTAVVDLYTYIDNDIELDTKNKVNINKPNKKSNRHKIYDCEMNRHIKFNKYNIYYFEEGLTEEQFTEYLKNKSVAKKIL
tara:strand:- start:570 stop:881 length:312 start_codon:yes stop_codon:yes gene_type:complete